MTTHLSSSLVNSVNKLNGVEVVQSGVQPSLVHDGNTGVDALLVQFHHRVRNVRSGNDVLLEFDRRLDDVGVEGVRDEGDDEIVGGNGCVEGSFVRDVNRDGRSRAGEGRRESLRRRKSATSYLMGKG